MISTRTISPVHGTVRPADWRPAPLVPDAPWEPFGSFRAFLGLPGSLRPPILKELRAAAEGRANTRRTVPPPPGDGRAILLIPDFMSGDRSLRPLRRWLTAAGWTVYPSGLVNSACGEVTATAISVRLQHISWLHGGPVTVLGHSRGGQLAHVLGVRHPELVSEVLTLASPLTDPFAMHLGVRLLAAGCSLLTRLGVPGLVENCPFGVCCQRFHDDVLATSKVPLTCLWSRTDGIVDWQACQRPEAHNTEVHASHLGIANNRQTWKALAAVLATNDRTFTRV